VVVSAVFAFLHFLAAFGIFAAVFLEWQTMSRSPSYAEARRIQRCDTWYGLFAAMVLIVGFLRVYYFDKGSDFYLANPFFYAKLALFLSAGLLSIYPTLRFLEWRAQTRQGQPPVVSEQVYQKIMLAIRLEMVLLLGVALCGSLMARGVGVWQ